MSITTIEPEDMDADAARELTTRLQKLLTEAGQLLRAARDGGAWRALGHVSWNAYVEIELAGFALPPAMIEPTARELRAAGWSHRAIAKPLGRSEGTIRKLTADIVPSTVIGADDRVYAAARRAPASADVAVAPPTKTSLALASLLAAGPDGLTGPELGRRRKWDHGRYSATLTRLHQQGRVVRLAERRGEHTIYVHPDHTGQRPVLPAPARRLALTAA